MSFLTGSQLRAARALLGWSASVVQAQTGVAVSTISIFENSDGTTGHRRTWDTLQAAFEAAGVVFLDPDPAHGLGPGVRVKADRPIDSE